MIWLNFIKLMGVGKTHYFIQQCKIPQSADFVWDLINRKSFFVRFLPPWLNIEIIDSPSEFQLGAQCRFRVLNTILAGIWNVEVVEMKPGFVFGFKISKDDGSSWIAWIKCLPTEQDNECVLEDRFEFSGKLIGVGYVRKIERVLKSLTIYKNRTFKNDLNQSKKAQVSGKNILIAGGSGLVGRILRRYLMYRGNVVDILSTKEGFGAAQWNPAGGMINDDVLEGRDIILNLAGSSIDKRWTDKNRELILNSRIDSSHLLVKKISRLHKPPELYIQASAVGFYGLNRTGIVSESSDPGEGFLSEVCQKWEREVRLLDNTSTRVAVLRLGALLTPEGGALARMLPLFKHGLGGRLGNGKQFFSWVSANDLSYLVETIIRNEAYEGVINVCAPTEITNDTFTDAMLHALGKRGSFPVPSFALKLLFGQMANEILLDGAKVSPEKAMHLGFEYLDDDIYRYLQEVIII